MGAMPWQEMGPWHDDPRESLKDLQAKYLADHYDLPSLIREHLDSAKEAVRLTEAKGDRYNLLDVYKSWLELFERLSREPLPEDPQARLGIVRQIYETLGEGIGNILDVQSASEAGDLFVARILTSANLQELFGTSTPTREMAESIIPKLSPPLDRGESICLPVFNTEDKPVGWWFAGYSID